MIYILIVLNALKKMNVINKLRLLITDMTQQGSKKLS